MSKHKKKYVVSRKLDLKQITIDWLRKYERFMVENNRSYTTIGIYTRTIRTVMNDAIMMSSNAPTNE